MWIILALLALIFLLPYGVDVGYREGVFFLRVKAGPLRIRLLPKKEKTPEQQEKERLKKERKAAEKKAKKEQKGGQEPGGEAEKKKKKSFIPKAGLGDWLELAKAAMRALGRIFRSFHVDYLQFHCTLGSPDPYDTATRYGYLCAAVEALLDEKNGILRIRRKDVSLNMDFLSESTSVEGELVISAALWRLTGAAIILGVEFLCWRRRLIKKEEKITIDPARERTEDNGREQNQ